jgi:hypothetical protein
MALRPFVLVARSTDQTLQTPVYSVGGRTSIIWRLMATLRRAVIIGNLLRAASASKVDLLASRGREPQ